jgi:hypothetical protein
MPDAAFRPCAGGCGKRVHKGKCPNCARQYEQARGSAWKRGYNSAWHSFREQFIVMLQERGILPICGATLPNGPQTQDSQCKGQGIQEWQALHFDHEPPLQPHERNNMHAVCNPLRIQLLCPRDHSRKTERELKSAVSAGDVTGGYRHVR